MQPVLLAFLAFSVAAVPDPASLEREAKQIERLIIAPCCWTQPVSDHYSAEAEEIRVGIRRLLGEGKTRDQILAVYVAQYGERVLSEPPARGFKAGLHVLPWVMLGLGGLVVALLVVHARFRRPVAVESGPDVQGQPAGGTPEGDKAYADRLDEELRKLE